MDLAPLSPDELVIARETLDELIAAQVGAGKDRVVAMYVQLGAVLPSKQRPDSEEAAAVEVYADCLQDIPLDILHAAYRRLVNTCRFFPTVAEIRAACGAEQHRRAWLISRLRMMIKRPVAGDSAVDPDTAERAAAMRRDVLARYPSRRIDNHGG